MPANIKDQLWAWYFARADWAAALTASSENLKFGKEVNSPMIRGVAHNSYTANYGVLAKFEEGVFHADKTLEYFKDSNVEKQHMLLLGNSMVVTAGSWRAWSLSLLGYPDQAIEQAEKALDLALIRYERGLSDNLELLGAEAAFAAAELNIIQGRVAYNLSAVRVAHALGVLSLEWLQLSLPAKQGQVASVP